MNIIEENPSRKPIRKGGINPRTWAQSPYSLVVLLALLELIFLIPVGEIGSDIPEVGDVSKKEIIAPFTFPILKTESELAKERETVRKNVPFVLKYSRSVQENAIASFNSSWNNAERVLKNKGLPVQTKTDSLLSIFPSLSNESARIMAELRYFSDLRDAVISILGEIFSSGIFSWSSIKGDTAVLFCVHWQNKDEVVPAERVTTTESARTKFENKAIDKFKNYPDKSKIAFELGSSFLAPNLLPDIERTRENRLKAIEGTKRERGIVLKDQRIVDAHEEITEETRQKLISLSIARSKRITKRPLFYDIFRVLARFVLVLLILAVMTVFIKKHFSSIWRNKSRLLVVLFAVWIPGFFAFVFHIVGWNYLLSPVAFSATLIAMLFGTSLAVVAALASAFLVALPGEISASFLMILVVQGVIASFVFGHISSRRKLIQPILYVLLSAVITSVVLDFISVGGTGKIITNALWTGGGALFGPLLVIPLLPLFESISKVVSDFTLVEFTNTNTPLLQRLAIEAPGTFHHSIVVGNLAETAAKSIGANPILARVGAFYHDIGKLKNPELFSENIVAENPHDKLDPFESFALLSAHVKDGVHIAHANSMPKPVVDIIEQHHGTSVMWYFYEKARNIYSSVFPEDFRYVGPKPQTKESAIVMLADTIEARLRSIENREPANIDKLVKNAIEEKFILGELSLCELSTKDLNVIHDSFVKILEGVLHRRHDLSYSREIFSYSEETAPSEIIDGVRSESPKIMGGD